MIFHRDEAGEQGRQRCVCVLGIGCRKRWRILLVPRSNTQALTGLHVDEVVFAEYFARNRVFGVIISAETAAGL